MSHWLIRLATIADQSTIRQLIADSVRTLATNEYSLKQIELALNSAWGLDTQLIRDKTYFVVERHQQMVAVGGWSFRKTLFGNDQESRRDPEKLDPQCDAAKIRAFFVHPDFARQGVASLLMQHCEEQARQMGFTRLELMSTLPGKPLYERHGFVAETAIQYPLDEDTCIEFVPMQKSLC